MAFELPIKAETVNSSSYISDGISLQKNTSSFSLYYSIAGSGSVDFFVHTSPDGYNFVKQSRALKRGVSAGENMIHLPVIPCDAFKIEVEETAGSAMAVTAKINLLPGRFGDFPQYDGSTTWTKTIGGPHHEIHDENHYFVVGFLDIDGVDDVLDMTWQMPDTTKWTHWVWEIEPVKSVTFYVYEDVVATNALSETMTIFNSHRNSDKTSGTVLKYEIQADLATANADTAVGGDAKLLESGVVGDGKNKGGIVNRDDELVLKQGSLYCLRAVASAAGVINFRMFWYEHRDR